MFKLIEQDFKKFIWNNKKAKIPLHVLQLSVKDGGLNLTNLRLRDKALKISWIQILQSDKKTEEICYAAIGGPAKHLREDIWRLNLHKKDIKNFFPNINTFWENMLQAWCEVNYDKNIDADSQIVWGNSFIRTANGPIFYGQAAKKGLRTIGQLCENGDIIPFEKAKQEYDINFIQWNSLKQAIPQEWKEPSGTLEPKFLYDVCLNSKNLAKKMYGEMNERKFATSEKHQWWANYLNTSSERVKTALQKIRNITNTPKLRSFQYRLLHRAIITNEHLYRWKKTESSLCTFCEKSVETYKHLFVECEQVKPLWTECQKLIAVLTDDDISLDAASILLSHVAKKATSVANFVTTVCKQYIYRKQCQKQLPNPYGLKQEIYTVKNMEKYIAVKNNKLHTFVKKWESLNTFSVLNQNDYLIEYLSQI